MGPQIDYMTEFKAGFGNYVEAYDPKVRSNTMQSRSEPCLALYPVGNVSGSWILWNVKTNSYVQRGNFKKLYMPDRIIGVLNKDAGKDGISLPEQVGGD